MWMSLCECVLFGEAGEGSDLTPEVQNTTEAVFYLSPLRFFWALVETWSLGALVWDAVINVLHCPDPSHPSLGSGTVDLTLMGKNLDSSPVHRPDCHREKGLGN
jgi:hypothetical protein